MTQLFERPTAKPRPDREQALALARQRLAARRWRTRRLRRYVASIAAAAFIGPFAVVYEQMAAGADPALSQSPATSTALERNEAASAMAATGGVAVRAEALARAKRRAAERAAARRRARARALRRMRAASAAAAAPAAAPAQVTTSAVTAAQGSGSSASTSSGSTSSGSTSTPTQTAAPAPVQTQQS